MGVPSPALYRYAANREYEKIPLRVATHAIDIYWTDRYGSTALHLLCQDRSEENPQSLLRAVDAIVRVAPEVVAWANAATWSPLHFASEKRHSGTAEALVLHLMAACPQAVSLRTKSGFKSKTPFHIACEADASFSVLKSMLSTNPRLALEPFVPQEEEQHSYTSFENPLQLLWRNGHEQQRRTLETFKKMALLLQAAYCGSVRRSAKANNQFSLVNAVCTVRCPLDYARIILEESPVNEPDSRGLLPLHYAVQPTRTPPHYTLFIIQHLLRKAPETAAVADGDGRHPLHLAIASGLTWHKSGVRELSTAYTEVLRRPDPQNGLVPALCSATKASESRIHLSTTLELLLMAPEVVTCPSNPEQ